MLEPLNTEVVNAVTAANVGGSRGAAFDALCKHAILVQAVLDTIFLYVKHFERGSLFVSRSQRVFVELVPVRVHAGALQDVVVE